MKIYFVRHGESEGNVKKQVQTREEPLTERGKRQSELLGTVLSEKNIHFEYIFSSTFYRAQQTTEILQTYYPDVSVEKSLLFGELEFPTMIQGKKFAGEAKNVLEKLVENYHDGDYRHSDEETFEDFKSRGIRALSKITSTDAENILVVTHGTLIKLFVGLLLFGESLDSYQFLRLRKTMLTTNTGVTAVEYRPDEVNRENHGWRFLTYSSHDHLLGE